MMQNASNSKIKKYNKFSFYGISKFNTRVEPLEDNYPNELLKFDVRLSAFKARFLEEDKVKINFL